MTKNNKRTINVIAMRTLAVAVAMSMTLLSYVPAYAGTYSLGYLDNGDGTLYDEERGCYVSMDEYHAASGYYWEDEYGMYTYRDENGVGFCGCTACEYMREGHNIVVPNEDNSGAAENTTDNTSETADQEAAKPVVYMVGVQTSADNASGEGWNYDAESNTLTLDNYKYEGTGLFNVSDDSAETGSEESDAINEAAEDEEYIGEDEELFEEEGEWDIADDAEDTDEAGGDTETEEDTSAAEATKPVTGVINSDGDLTLKLKGESYITVTDENSDSSYGVNTAGELKVEGDGVLFVKTATDEKVYGTPAEEAADTGAGNSGTINNNDIDVNNNDGDVTQTVNEAATTQTVNEAETNQTVNEGDVSVNNNVSLPDINNTVNVPDVISNNTFNPNITVELPKSSVEKAIIRDVTTKSQAVESGEVKGVSTEPEQKVGAVDASKTDHIVTPDTSDSRNWGVIFALAGTIIMGAVTLIVFGIRRYRETTIG